MCLPWCDRLEREMNVNLCHILPCLPPANRLQTVSSMGPFPDGWPVAIKWLDIVHAILSDLCFYNRAFYNTEERDWDSGTLPGLCLPLGANNFPWCQEQLWRGRSAHVWPGGRRISVGNNQGLSGARAAGQMHCMVLLRQGRNSSPLHV